MNVGHCRDCYWWDGQRLCERPSFVDMRDHIDADDMAFFAMADDDQGLIAGVLTGPDFGCTKFRGE